MEIDVSALELLPADVEGLYPCPNLTCNGTCGKTNTSCTLYSFVGAEDHEMITG